VTTVTQVERAQDQAWEYLRQIIGTRYKLWTGGIVPAGPPAWGRNGEPPDPGEVRRTSCFCAGVPNLARRAVGLEIPTLGNENFDGGVVAYFGATGPAPASFPRQGYFERHGRQRPFDLEKAQRPWTLVGRKYRSVGDQGHVGIVLPDGRLLQSFNGPGGKPGVNKDVTLRQSHFSWGPRGGYEFMVFAEDWLLPFDAAREEPPQERPERERPERERPERERPERERPERPERPEQPEREEVVIFTAKQFLEMAENPQLGLATAEKYRKALTPEMRKAGITTPQRMAAFFGNVMVETDRGNTLEEYGNEHYFRYGPPSGDGLYLGDQWRYHGRGFLMNTWRDAYANLSKVLGEDLVANPDLLERPDLAAKAATWFWDRHDLNSYADRGEFRAVAAIINTGRASGTPNHWLERLHFYDVAKRVLSSGPRVPDRGLERNGFNRDGLPFINLVSDAEADDVLAFALAMEIRRAGIGVTVTNGRESVYALAKKIRGEPLGYRQLWIVGQQALEACGEFRELANWPISPKTDYYNLAGKDFTGTCRRAAELADEKAKKGVGPRFLEVMEESTSRKSPIPTPAPEETEEQEYDGKREREEYRKDSEERAEETEKDRDYPEEEAPGKWEERRGDRYDEPDGSEPIERIASPDLRDTELEELGREVIRLIRSYTGQSKTPRRESDGHNEKEGD
jgi:putative chitinase